METTLTTTQIAAVKKAAQDLSVQEIAKITGHDAREIQQVLGLKVEPLLMKQLAAIKKAAATMTIKQIAQLVGTTETVIQQVLDHKV